MDVERARKVEGRRFEVEGEEMEMEIELISEEPIRLQTQLSNQEARLKSRLEWLTDEWEEGLRKKSA